MASSALAMSLLLAVYGMLYDATAVGPTILHFDPDTIALPLGYDSHIAEDFTFPYLYVTVPDGEFPGQSFRMVVEKQADMNDQQVYLQDTEGNWLAWPANMRPTGDLLNSSGRGALRPLIPGLNSFR